MNKYTVGALALAAALLPSLALARSSDRRQPMDIESGHTAYSMDDNSPTVLTGGVTIVQGTLNVQSTRADITQRKGDPVRVVLTGAPVRLSQQLDDGTPMNARASKVDYDLTTEIVTFDGDVNISQPRGTLSGAHVVYNMKTGQVNSGGGGQNGRVKMRLVPRGAQAGG